MTTQEILKLEELKSSETNHILHLILSIVTTGFWIPVWFITYIVNSNKRNNILHDIKEGI